MRKQIIFALFLIFALHLTGAERVVSLGPNLTEIIYHLGQEQLLVGRSSACNYPPEVKKLPVAGDYGKIFTEPLLALKPSLVVMQETWDDTVPATLRKLNIRSLVFTAHSFEEYLNITTELGKALDCVERADRIVSDTRRTIEQFRAEVREIPLEKRPRVLFIISENQIYTAGKRSFITDIIELAGGCNIAASQDRDYFTVSPEWIVREQPDILIMPGATPQRVKVFLKKPAIKELNAVKNGRILTDIDPDIVFRLGPRTLDGVRRLRDYFRASESGERIQK
jgi:iron complex transport system substrate-binding protein